MKDENPFKEKLYHHTLPVNEQLWGRIESQLPADKKRFPILLYALAAIMLLTGLLLFWTSLRQNSHQENIIPEKTLPAPVTPLSETSTKISYPSDISASNFENESHNDSYDESQNSSYENPIATNSGSHPLPQGKSRGKSQAKSVESISGSTISHDPEFNSHSVKSLNQTDVNISQTQAPGELETVASSYTNLAQESVTKRSLTPDHHFQSLSFTGINQIITEEEKEETLSGILAIRPDPSCYKFTGEEGKSNLSVDLFVGPGFAPRSFENPGDESILYAEARNETESAQYAWSAGGRVNLNLNKEFAVRLGLIYEQVGDIFDYTDTLATQRSTRIDSFFSADGTFLYAETNTVLIFGTLIKKIHNRYHHLDIPLLASYELCMGRAIIMINAGPVINLTTSSRGQILNPVFVPQYITDGEQNQLKAYKSNVGLSVYLGAGALIPLNKSFSGLIEPRFLYRIKPVTLDSYPLKEHRHFAGINLGIRYHFD